jgi:hypothetical protein
MYEKYLSALTEKDKSLLNMYLRGLITFEYIINLITNEYLNEVLKRENIRC